ncbi:MAG: Rieske 2Fe-2S domain-containing protein [Polyangiales bacterium]
MPTPSKTPNVYAPIIGAWYPVAFSSEVRASPMRVVLFDRPWLLFRMESGEIAALEDRCPHRNAPLSAGTICGNTVQCAYHGWRFVASGNCVAIPGEPSPSARVRVPSAVVVEKSGTVYLRLGEADARWPEPFDALQECDERFRVIRKKIDFDARFDDVAENALDVPHTAFLHRPLFRQSESELVRKTDLRRGDDFIEIEYLDERAPSGVLGKLLSINADTVEHWDRFVAPSIAQVEYKIAEDAHLIATAALCPTHADKTAMFATVAFRTGRADVLIERLARPLAMLIVRQDVDMLRAQSLNMKAFGGAAYRSTRLDQLGDGIRNLVTSLVSG